MRYDAMPHIAGEFRAVAVKYFKIIISNDIFIVLVTPDIAACGVFSTLTMLFFLNFVNIYFYCYYFIYLFFF